jgi:hypothetical protein
MVATQSETMHHACTMHHGTVKSMPVMTVIMPSELLWSTCSVNSFGILYFFGINIAAHVDQLWTPHPGQDSGVRRD